MNRFSVRVAAALMTCGAASQGLTLVHFAAQRKCFLWDREYIWGLFRGRLRGTRGYYGVFRVCFVSETSQVELKTGQLRAPAASAGSSAAALDCRIIDVMNSAFAAA